MSDQELDSMWHMARPYFRAAVREAIAAETKRLVDALRPFAATSCKCHEGYPASKLLFAGMNDCNCSAWESSTIGNIREAARLVAEYDAAQKGPTP